jgi:NADH:ubiquinone oxidoreductase subunit 6 (subunit J)
MKTKIKEILKTAGLAMFPFIATGIWQKNKKGITWQGIILGITSGLLIFLTTLGAIMLKETDIVPLEEKIEEQTQTIREQETQMYRLADQLFELNRELEKRQAPTTH